MHLNIVQFIYAFLLGLVLAILMDRADHVYPAMIGHVTANLIAVLRTETGILAKTMDKSVFAWVVSVLLMGIGVTVFVLYLKKESFRDQ